MTPKSLGLCELHSWILIKPETETEKILKYLIHLKKKNNKPVIYNAVLLNTAIVSKQGQHCFTLRNLFNISLETAEFPYLLLHSICCNMLF